MTVFFADFAAAAREAHDSKGGLGGELLPEEVHGVGVHGEHHGLGVAGGAEFFEFLAQAAGLGVGWQLANVFEEASDVVFFFLGQGLALQDRHFIGGQHFTFRVGGLGLGLVVWLLEPGRLAGLHSGQAVFEGVPQRVEAAGQAAPVDGHDEADGVLFFGGSLVVGRADVIFDLFVDAGLVGGERNEAVVNLAVGDWRQQLASFVVAAEQVAGVAGDEPTDGGLGA